MKKIVLLIGMFMMFVFAYSQMNMVADVKFNTIPAGWTVSPSGGWGLDNGLFVSSPSSAVGYVPNSTGDSVVLTSPYYDFTNYQFVFLRFSHICKVSTSDICKVYIQEDYTGAKWQELPSSSYQGDDNMAYRNNKFSHESYSDWVPSDSLAVPTNGWWKTEPFDISDEASYAKVRFKFVIKRGSVLWTQFAYGWLIDNFELMASTDQIAPPHVEFLSGCPTDTVYNTGPYPITARIASRTIASLNKPIYLYVKYINNSVTTYDTLTMTMVAGDTIWSTIIPQKPYGTYITYELNVSDSLGNNALDISAFYIKRIVVGDYTGYVTIGNNEVSTYYNILYYAYYSWTRQLYLSSEVNPSGSGGLITKIAFRPSSTWNINNQACYFKAVDDVTITTTNYIDPETDGSVKVWEGTYSISANTWSEIILNKSFILPAGKNLMVYWINKAGSGNTTTWSATSTASNYRAIYKYQSGSFPTTAGTNTYNRPDVRLYIEGYLSNTNSVALYSIDNPTDSVVAAPLHQSPVIVTIKNKGIRQLDSCYIHWTVNGIVKPTYVWRGNLVEGFSSQQLIGYYTPSVNQCDTIVAWTSYPNGVIDSTTNDDTLRKIAFGVTGLDMHFTVGYGDTVFTTGPFYITAKVKSRTLQLVQQPVILKIVSTFQGVPTNNSIPMTHIGNDIYACTTPQYLMGSQVNLSITVRDSVGNNVSIYKDFYLKRGVVLNFDSITVDHFADGGTWAAPFWTSSVMCWSKSVYSPYFLGNRTDTVLINGLSWYGGINSTYSPLSVRSNQRVYFKIVSDTIISNYAYEDPVSNGYTLVWSGGITTPGIPNNWFGINLQNLFYLPPGQSLVIYMLDSTGVGTPGNNLAFRFMYAPSGITTVYQMSATPTTFASMNGAATDYIPHIRLYLTRTKSDSNAVGLYSIDSPLPPSVVANPTGYPVRVTLRNKGLNNLTSCQVEWELNGVNQGTTNWSGNLLEDFNDTITIGWYYSSANKTDNINVWVKNPNGIVDPTPNDDTISINIYGQGGVDAMFIEPLVDDTVFYNGPFNIHAKIVSRTNTPLITPVLKYNWIYQSIPYNDSIVMTNMSGDSIWFAAIPKNVFGTTINFSITVIDSFGNQITISSYCYLQRGASDKITDTVIIGTMSGTGLYVLPYDARYAYSWTRNMFLSSEIGNTSDTLTIIRIAWKPTGAGVITRSNQAMYMKAVDASITVLDQNNTSFNPNADGATLVWYGGMTTDGTLDWQEITLLYPFPVPTGKNMVMYFIDSTGSTSGAYPWHCENATNMAMYAADAMVSPSNLAGSMLTYRSYNRLCLGKMTNDENAVGITAINSPLDTVVMVPGLILPVNVTLENKGISNLDSCLLHWSLNGVMQSTTPWYGSLPERYIDTITLGYYIPTAGNSDEIVVWATMPNGINDTLSTYDDTLIVKSFAKTGIILSFSAPYVVDTILNTGPFQINAIGKSLTMQPLGTLRLNFSYTYNNITTHDSSLMMQVIDSLWRVVIAKKSYGTNVVYSISMIDSMGNHIVIQDSFYVKRPDASNIIDSIQVGTSLTGGIYSYPFNTNGAGNNWSRSLYLSQMLGNTNRSVTICGLSYVTSNNFSHSRYHSQCYLKVTNASLIGTSDSYVDPINDGATLVYKGTWTTKNGWNQFIFDTPFVLPQGYNLLVYWVDTSSLNQCNNSSTVNWAYNQTSSLGANYNAVDRHFTNYLCSSSGGGAAAYLPTTLFYFGGSKRDSNSVALVNVFSPTDTVQSYVNTPISVVIKNMGISNLTSCNISWTINGVLQPIFNWTGNLAEDFEETVVLGYFRPMKGNTYNFTFTVSLPNNVYDSTTYDNYLSKTTYADFIGKNLSMQFFTSPINNPFEVCFPENISLGVRVANTGSVALVLNSDNITIHYKVSGPITLQDSIVLSKGVFSVGTKDIIIDTVLNINLPGIYHFEAFLSCPFDTLHFDDTITLDYNVKKLALPYDNDFSAISSDISIIQNAGYVNWIQDTNPSMTPVYGTGALYFNSALGAGHISMAMLQSINLKGTLQPTLDFWFAHDTMNSAKPDRIDVQISTNGYSFSNLLSVNRYDANFATAGWEKYSVDLSSYSSETCVIIAFVASSYGGGDMWIDRIMMTSSQEVGIELDTLSELIACELDHKQIKVKILNNTLLPVDFDETTVVLHLDLTGVKTISYTDTLSGILSGSSVMEVLLDNDFDFTLNGNYNFRAYITNIDGLTDNDTASLSIVISPDISLVSINPIGVKGIKEQVYPTVLIRNTGNLTVKEVPIRIKVNETNDVTETAFLELAAGKDTLYTLNTPYVVPLEPTYDLMIIAELSCDPIPTNDTLRSTENVNEPPIKVQNILRPSSSNCDSGLTVIYPQIVINNTGNPDINVIVHLNMDTASHVFASFVDTIAFVLSGTTTYNFTKSYVVPNLPTNSTYNVKAYVYSPTYTYSQVACVIHNDVSLSNIRNDAWTLGQNIPNPAMSTTSIPYTIPEDGKIIFKVMSISGQVLYMEDIQAVSGSNYLELNTESIANGIYYYSMEYKGQTIVKKMSIHK